MLVRGLSGLQREELEQDRTHEGGTGLTDHTTEFTRRIAEELHLRAQPSRKPPSSLLDEGNTIPFIARYRKEMTGELDENQLRDVQRGVCKPCATSANTPRGSTPPDRRARQDDPGTRSRHPEREDPDRTGRPLPPLPSEAQDTGMRSTGKRSRTAHELASRPPNGRCARRGGPHT